MKKLTFCSLEDASVGKIFDFLSESICFPFEEKERLFFEWSSPKWLLEKSERVEIDLGVAHTAMIRKEIEEKGYPQKIWIEKKDGRRIWVEVEEWLSFEEEESLISLIGEVQKNSLLAVADMAAGKGNFEEFYSRKNSAIKKILEQFPRNVEIALIKSPRKDSQYDLYQIVVRLHGSVAFRGHLPVEKTYEWEFPIRTEKIIFGAEQKTTLPQKYFRTGNCLF